MTKERILWYGDSPTCASGFGQVSEGITSRLLDDYKFDFWAINYRTKDRNDFPEYDDCRFEDAQSNADVYGRVDFVDVLDNTRADKYDYLVMFQDAPIMSAYLEEYEAPFISLVGSICQDKDIDLISYFPVDAEPYSTWVAPVLKASDLCLTYTDWAIDQIENVVENDDEIKSHEYDLHKLYHGTDLDTFYPIDGRCQDKVEKFDLDDRFVVGYMSANQQRKNIVRDVIYPYVYFHQNNPNSTLLMKTSPIEQQGWNLVRVLRKFKRKGLIDEKSVRFYSEKRIPKEEINEFYNMCDVYYLPSMEGWGLGATEAMATETLTLTADHGALSEVAEPNRSVKVDVPKDKFSNNKAWFTLDNDVLRTMVDLKDVVNKLDYIKNDMSNEEKQEKISNGKTFVKNYTWDSIAKKFNQYLGSLKYS